MNKKMYFIAGAAVAAVSAAMVVGYAVKKKKEQAAGVGLLLAGIAGFVGSAILAYQPEKEAQEKLTVHELIDEGDEALMHENFTEILGSAADRGETPEKLRHIELDEDTTIEDFIF